METAHLAKLAEEAGLNATAPPQEAWLEGWLIRLSPGKAKRARCVNALQQGKMPLQDLLARCQASFDAAGLPLILRITPFSQPPDLDTQLQALGWASFDAADVMVLADLPPARCLGAQQYLQTLDNAAYAALVGELRGSSAREVAAHAERMQASPVPYQGFALRGHEDQLLACGQIAVEGKMAGLYDIFTPPEVRGQGHGHSLCSALLAQAAGQGAHHAYLQVGSDNEAALRLYQRLGFSFAYRYHYRCKDAAAAW